MIHYITGRVALRVVVLMCFFALTLDACPLQSQSAPCCQAIWTGGREALNAKEYAGTIAHFAHAGRSRNPCVLMPQGRQMPDPAANSQRVRFISSVYGDTVNSSLPASIQKLEADMVPVAGGVFAMGCKEERDGNCYDSEKPSRVVSVPGFSMGKYEVTQAQWHAVMGSNPSSNQGCDDCPVEWVSWNDIQEFLKKLNALTGKSYRLPTEAEWEYAACGGGQSRGYRYSGSDKLDEVGWFFGNYKAGNTYGAKKTTRPVGTKQPNELGLYDMSGNVAEWCEDDWYFYYEDVPTDGQAWVDSPRGGTRMMRGGSWYSYDTDCRCAYRTYLDPSHRYFDFGFRLAL